MEQSQLPKWEGTMFVKLPSIKADQAWSLLSSFCSVHLWIPFVETCRKVAGDDGRPGCVRYCTGRLPAGCGEEPAAIWANEELLAFDPADRSYRYEVTENNMGLRRYVATLKVLPEEEGGGGCKLGWSFDAEPVEAWTRDGLVAFLQSGLEGMAKKIEETLQAKPSPAD